MEVTYVEECGSIAVQYANTPFNEQLLKNLFQNELLSLFLFLPQMYFILILNEVFIRSARCFLNK